MADMILFDVELFLQRFAANRIACDCLAAAEAGGSIGASLCVDAITRL
jgi:hypothetical protein